MKKDRLMMPITYGRITPAYYNKNWCYLLKNNKGNYVTSLQLKPAPITVCLQEEKIIIQIQVEYELAKCISKGWGERKYLYNSISELSIFELSTLEPIMNYCISESRPELFGHFFRMIILK